MSSLRLSLSVCLALCLSACDSGSGGGGADAKAAEAKKQEQEKADADAAKAVAERKAKREAEEKAKAEAEAKVAAEVERLTVAPEKLPKDPVAACDAVGQAHDAFVRRTGDAKAVADWDAGGKDKTIPMTIVQCTQADSVKTAACQKAALEGAGPELKDAAKKLLQACIDKFGSKRAPPAGMPQRRPG